MRIRTILTLLVCVCLSSYSVTKKTKKNFPGREDIIEMLMQQRDAVIEKRASHVPIKKFCKFPEDSKIVTVNNNEVIPFNDNWVQPFCNPRPIPVPLDVPTHFNIFPTYVMLHRCVGGFYSRLEQCVAKTKERVIVKYKDLDDYQERDAIMYNHTSCTQNCIVKAEDCNPNTETYKNCICNCNIDASHCNSTWQSFNSHKCNCDCKFVQKCTVYTEWNPKTCKCECAKCIEDMCTKANLVLDKDNYRCT